MAVTLMTLGGQSSLQEYKCDSNDALKLKLVKCIEDINDESMCFKPVMSHQVFGQSETVFGYKGLQIELIYTASKLITFLRIGYDEQINSEEHDGVKPDDILRSLAKHIPAGFYTNLDKFTEILQTECTFKPFGELLHSYKRKQEGAYRQFEIYKCAMQDVGFKEYHERLQTFLLWYVDAASFIDVDDEKWTFYLIYERFLTKDGKEQYGIVGYQTVYLYYAYPAHTRPRISQVLVLPPYQRQGHGAELLQTFYRECWSNQNVLDITVEDPSEDYQRMRDFVDVKNCMNTDLFSAEMLKDGFTSTLTKAVQKRLKINKKQCRRIYEIIKFKQTTPETLKSFRLEVKKRLYQPFQQSRKELTRMRQALEENEFEASTALTIEQKHQYLETCYLDLVDEYRHILEKVASFNN